MLEVMGCSTETNANILQIYGDTEQPGEVLSGERFTEFWVSIWEDETATPLTVDGRG